MYQLFKSLNQKWWCIILEDRTIISYHLQKLSNLNSHHCAFLEHLRIEYLVVNEKEMHSLFYIFYFYAFIIVIFINIFRENLKKWHIA